MAVNYFKYPGTDIWVGTGDAADNILYGHYLSLVDRLRTRQDDLRFFRYSAGQLQEIFAFPYPCGRCHLLPFLIR